MTSHEPIRESIRALAKQGKREAEIAEMLRVHRNTVYHYRKQLG
jgi:DNA-binding CsgD family transcriptional regulator